VGFGNGRFGVGGECGGADCGLPNQKGWFCAQDSESDDCGGNDGGVITAGELVCGGAGLAASAKRDYELWAVDS